MKNIESFYKLHFNFFSMLHLYRGGFTLIELIIVMAILGVLAVGLIAAVDPIEQSARSNDAAKINTAKQIYDAIGRYYASKNALPWTTNQTAVALSTTTVGAIVNTVATAGDMKSNYLTSVPSTTLANVYLSGDATAASPTYTICALVTSKSQKSKSTLYTDSAGATAAGATCTAAACYSCYK
jgi:prepilin-type N-terminal cleavage/methylation domain-containing protein